jgi:hypothetical protein
VNIEEKEKTLQRKKKQTNKPGTAVNIHKVLSSFLRLLKKIGRQKKVYAVACSFPSQYSSPPKTRKWELARKRGL